MFLDESEDVFLYDFDNGTAANDAFGLIGAVSNLGLGNNEALMARGDSGGPTLIDGKIAGISSFFGRGPQGDIDGVVNASFGEVGAKTRVSVFASWIDSVVDIVAPTVPGALDLIAGSDSGTSSTDNLTNDTTPSFTWTASSGTGSTISGYWWAVDDNTPQTGGTFTTSLSATPTVTGNGNHTVYVAAVDSSGNIGAPASLAFTIDTAGPRVSNVLVAGLWWNRNPYSFASLAAAGKQLAPIGTTGADQIHVQYNEAVSVSSSDLKLYGTNLTGTTPAEISNFGFDANIGANTSRWWFNLGADKYRLDLMATVTDVAGNKLDGEWTNLTNGTYDIFTGDPSQSFPSGNGITNTNGNAFQFMFSILPGDSNQDGIVTSADTTGTVVDVDGNGVVNFDDYAAIGSLDGTRLRFRVDGGDYNDDERVDFGDYARWRATFGSTVSAYTGADGDGSGEIDATDYVVWQNVETIGGAWYTGPGGAGASIPIVDLQNPPQVTNVTISGSNSTHDPYSFDGHDGSGEQLRTVPVGGADTVSITFSEDVNVVASNFKMVGLYTGNIPELAAFNYDIGTMTASWRFVGWTFGDQYAITLTDSVTDIEGNLLDGEWVNPSTLTTTNGLVSEFPSGDDDAGGDFKFIMTLLPGDANLDLQVTSADLTILQNHFNNGQIDELFSEADFTGDGVVDFDDVTLYSPHSGMNLGVVWLLADLDSDYDVDDDDLETLTDNIGMSNPTWADGDLDDDNAVSLTDLDLLFAQFGLDLEVVS